MARTPIIGKALWNLSFPSQEVGVPRRGACTEASRGQSGVSIPWRKGACGPVGGAGGSMGGRAAGCRDSQAAASGPFQERPVASEPGSGLVMLEPDHEPPVALREVDGTWTRG